jgi:hypothetical protein
VKLLTLVQQFTIAQVHWDGTFGPFDNGDVVVVVVLLGPAVVSKKISKS